MKRELFIHFAFWFAFFVLISIFKNYLSLSYWPFWVGGIVGNFLPDIDHLIYVFFLNPQELTSQRVNFLIKKREISRVLSLLYETRRERLGLVFHTFIFQIIFYVFSFFIVTSTTSIFVHGIVIALSMHLAVDQLVDYLEMKNLSNWGQLFSPEVDLRMAGFYVSAAFLLATLMGVLI